MGLNGIQPEITSIKQRIMTGKNGLTTKQPNNQPTTTPTPTPTPTPISIIIPVPVPVRVHVPYLQLFDHDSCQYSGDCVSNQTFAIFWLNNFTRISCSPNDKNNKNRNNNNRQLHGQQRKST